MRVFKQGDGYGVEEIARFPGRFASTGPRVSSLQNRAQLETAEHAVPSNRIHVARCALAIMGN